MFMYHLTPPPEYKPHEGRNAFYFVTAYPECLKQYPPESRESRH